MYVQRQLDLFEIKCCLILFKIKHKEIVIFYWEGRIREFNITNRNLLEKIEDIR